MNKSTARTELRNISVNSRRLAHQPAALFGADHGVPAAEIDCVFEVDRTSTIFRLPQSGGNVRHLNEAEVHGYVPKTLGELRELDTLARHDARDFLEFYRQRDHGLRQRSHLCDVLGNQERDRRSDPRQKNSCAGHARDTALLEVAEELIRPLRQR